MRAFAVDFQALELAQAHLEIENDVWVSLSPHPETVYGTYDRCGDEHHIWANTYRKSSPRELSRTLWHELEHARQAEGYTTLNEWELAYRHWRESFEAMARQAEKNHNELPLVVVL